MLATNEEEKCQNTVYSIYEINEVEKIDLQISHNKTSIEQRVKKKLFPKLKDYGETEA